MDSFEYGTPEPNVKFEPSPTESFMSTPGGEYSSLFANSPMPTMNPRDFMTPDSTQHDDDLHSNSGHSVDEQTPEPGAGDKKQTKKRKSWGQVLPEPKTNLPPRKRAKTEDEKEQRRVERVLRNRRAAQSSRERKRLETEALEKKNQDLEDKLDQANRMIAELLQRFGPSGSSPSFEALRPNPVTLSQELFNSQDGHMTPHLPTKASTLMDGIVMASSQPSNTVNPASLSPTLYPVHEEDEEDWLAQNDGPSNPAAPVTQAPATSEETFPDSTQLPAAKLCSSDLQCRSAEVPPQSWLTASRQPQLWLFLSLFSHIQLLAQMSLISACRQPLLQVAMSMRAGFSLPPTSALLNTIIWLVTTRRHSSTASTSATTSTTTTSTTSTRPASANSSSTASTTARSPASRSTTLRLRTLLRILSSSPHLARPLRDATLRVLRLAVSKKMNGVDGSGDEGSTTGTDGGVPSPQQRQQQDEEMEYMKHVPQFYTGGLPSVEVLFTLAWVCQVEEQKVSKRAQQGQSTEAFDAIMVDLETARSHQQQREVKSTDMQVMEQVAMAVPEPGC